MEITTKQELFISKYLLCFNATQAAKEAGYSEKTAYSIGNENLRKPEIRKAIEEKVNNALGDTALTLKHEIIQELKEVAFTPEGLEYKYNRDGELFEVSRKDKLKALELLGKYLSLFTDRIEVEADINVVVAEEDKGL